MKANEAPEKVYLLFNCPYLVDYAKLNKRRHEEEVEYTRTDAFVEKACDWIKMMWSETDDRFKEDYTGMLIEDFENYMKGE